MKHLLAFSEEVAQALEAGGPIVALESTIISHGMPWPQNLENATALEDEVRANGATPASIALHGGRLKVGLSASELEDLARTGQAVRKVSRRDFAPVMASGAWGATTVAATMMVAHLAGIRVFATGGIGGVHRGAEHDFDISADLTELGRTPVAVVCAGAKSILDLPKTLEVLETNGVPIFGCRSPQFPSFFTRSSGLEIEDSFDDEASLARVLAQFFDLPAETGCLVANPVPAEFALDKDDETRWIDHALAEAKQQGIKGKAVTPFLLGRLVELSDGATLRANRALVKNNAALGARLAVLMS